MGYEPENTLASFRKALELGVDMVELDVYLSKSGELVVIHDEKVDRATNGKGRVSDMTLDGLKTLDAGKGQRIPTLTEVLDLVNHRAKMIIELKSPGTGKAVLDLIDTYVKNRGWNYDDFLIISFDHPQLKEVQKMNRRMHIGGSMMALPADLAKFGEDHGMYAVIMSFHFVNQAFVDDAHQRGLKVLVWTVNELEDIARMKKLGVDGILSDFPDRVL